MVLRSRYSCRPGPVAVRSLRELLSALRMSPEERRMRGTLHRWEWDQEWVEEVFVASFSEQV
jgi:hypothetical protein